MIQKIANAEPVHPAPVTGDGCTLQLRRYKRDGKPVLLVHGASAGSDTYRIGEEKPLIAYLNEKRLDVWTLDWRASMHCARDIHEKFKDQKDSKIFTIDAAARYDVPAAIASMRKAGVTGAIALFGHCLGAGIIAQGIVQRSPDPPYQPFISADDVENVVLTGLGLFYQAAVDLLLKSEDRPLEEILARGIGLLDTKEEWDPLLEVPYKLWLQTPIAHKCKEELCHRLSYLYGMPYLPEKIPTIHDKLDSQFGLVPTQFLLHCTQNLRRGHAGPYNAGDDTSYLKPEMFRDRRVTLITGDVNCLWHRNSIDLMDDWLRRGKKRKQPRALRKHVLPGFGHQDLLWGTGAPDEVFPLVLEGLVGQPV